MNEALALAKEGMELHECNAPEYIVCAAVIRQAAEIERLRSVLDWAVQYAEEFPAELELKNWAVIARAALEQK